MVGDKVVVNDREFIIGREYYIVEKYSTFDCWEDLYAFRDGEYVIAMQHDKYKDSWRTTGAWLMSVCINNEEPNFMFADNQYLEWNCETSINIYDESLIFNTFKEADLKREEISD